MPTNTTTKASTKVPTRKAAAKKPAKAKPQPTKKRLSALDAAAVVLTENGRSMTTKELIEAMAVRKLWTSPNGQTPAATLYAAILREITVKGPASRFQKTQPGQFAATGKSEAGAKKPTAKGAPPKATGPKGAKKKPGGKKAAAPAEAAAVPAGTPGPESVPELFRL